mmetsp:Transcript_41279/g.62848  ORF Transcript_41279/g.62848 Transcript_41279/m.62848 type:complete len:85 (+) Transcript_41279:64-318(+)
MNRVHGNGAAHSRQNSRSGKSGGSSSVLSSGVVTVSNSIHTQRSMAINKVNTSNIGANNMANINGKIGPLRNSESRDRHINNKT